MPALRWNLVAAVAAVALASGCAEPRLGEDPHLDEATEGRCYDCHGDPANGNTAPPPMRLGDDESADPDPHQAHLQATSVHLSVPCASCHVVPKFATDDGHTDTELPAEIRWSGRALEGSVEPEYDPESRTCTNVPCHGSELEIGGGNATSPVWEAPEVSGQCDTCHGFPPPAPHVGATDCERCHTIAGPDATIVDATLHINGTVEFVDDLPCDACHGSDGNPAPPFDTQDETETTARGVGAHRAHLGASDFHAEIACTECHVVPELWQERGHADTELPAELTWGALASADETSPAFDGVRCDNVYCHGATLPGGSNTNPAWTSVGADEAACGTCHGVPPAAPHPDHPNCLACHGVGLDEGGAFVGAELHVNGRLDLPDEVACDGCHGSDGNPAPPPDLDGDTSTDARGVGAHWSHLAAAGWRADVVCDDCHYVPTDVNDPAHINGVVDFDWSDLAAADGADPSFDGTTCSNTYCHGTTLVDSGGSVTEPTWTLVDGVQSACGSCHSIPPVGRHPDQTQCSTCHGLTVAADGTWADRERHINGRVDFLR